MVNNGRGSPESGELEIHPGPHYLGFCNCLTLESGVALQVFYYEIAFPHHIVKVHIVVQNLGMIGVKAVFNQVIKAL